MKIKNGTKKFCGMVKDNLSFIVVMTATFVAIALIVTLTFGAFYEIDIEKTIDTGEVTVELSSQQIEDLFSSAVNTLDVTGYTVDNMMKNDATTESVEEYLVNVTQGIVSGIDEDFKGLYGVVNDVHVDGDRWHPEGYDPYSRPWYEAAAKNNKKIAITSPYVDAQTGETLISFSKILSDGKSALAMDVRLDNVYEAAKNIQLAGKGYCFITDEEGIVVAHRDASEIGKNYLSEEAAESGMLDVMKKVMQGGKACVIEDADVNGDSHIAFAHEVQDSWRVVLMVSSGDLFDEMRGTLVRNILLSLTLFILVGYFCASNYRNKKRALRYAEEVRTDDLTGLNNRGEFERYLRTLKVEDFDKKLYMLLFDADDFKSINDKYGHREGDRALRIVAKAIMETCHGTDSFCARYGGDEFVIVCRCDDEEKVKSIISDIAEVLNKAVTDNGLPYTLSLSCGYACFDANMESLSELLERADKYLYRNKSTKKE